MSRHLSFLSFIILCTSFLCADEGVQFSPITDQEVRVACKEEKRLMHRRQVIRHAKALGAIIGFCSTFAVAVELKDALLNATVLDNIRSLPIIRQAMVQRQHGRVQSIFAPSNVASKIGAWISAGMLTSLGSFIAGKALSLMWHSTLQATQDEKGLDFLRDQTDIAEYMRLLQGLAVGFDIYSPLLDQQLYVEDRRLCVHGFVQDVAKSFEQHHAGPLANIFEEHLVEAFARLRNRYIKQAQVLDYLQNYTVDAYMMQRRYETDCKTYIFEKQDEDRALIIALLQKLRKDVVRLVGFGLACYNNNPEKQFIARQLQHKMNSLLAYMQDALQQDCEQLYQKSRNGDGMFTQLFSFYEFLQKRYRIADVL